MIYKGYEGVLEVDQESGELFGTVKGLRDVVTFVGATVEEARASFEESVDFYLQCCPETGKKPDKPYAGKFLVRVTPETHRQAEAKANRTAVNKAAASAAADRRRSKRTRVIVGWVEARLPARAGSRPSLQDLTFARPRDLSIRLSGHR